MARLVPVYYFHVDWAEPWELLTEVHMPDSLPPHWRRPKVWTRQELSKLGKNPVAKIVGGIDYEEFHLEKHNLGFALPDLEEVAKGWIPPVGEAQIIWEWAYVRKVEDVPLPVKPIRVIWDEDGYNQWGTKYIGAGKCKVCDSDLPASNMFGMGSYCPNPVCSENGKKVT